MTRARRIRIRRWLFAVGLLLALLVGAAVAVLRVSYHGEALAERVEGALNHRMRGKIEVGSVEWELASLRKVVTGGWVPLTIRDVTIWDDLDRAEPSPILRVPVITAELDVHAVLFGDHDVVLRHVSLQGGWVRLQQTSEPLPLHDYDRTIVSLLSAFYPKAPPRFAAGLYASAPPPRFDLRDVTITDLDLEIWAAPSTNDQVFAGVVALDDVDAKGFLYMDSTDPVVSRLYFSVTPRAPTGRLQLLRDLRPGHAAAESTFELVDVVVERLAQLPNGWPNDSVANSLELALTASTPQGARFRLAGDLENWWARPYDGAWNLVASVEDVGPTLSAVIDPSLSGTDVSGTFRLTGPFVAPPRIAWERVRNLEYKLDLAEGLDPLTLRLGELNGAVDFVNDTGKLERSVALVPGDDGLLGRVTLDGTFDLDPYQPHLTIAITSPLDLGRFIDKWLPPQIGRSRGHLLSGSFVLDGDPQVSIGIEDLDLELRTQLGGPATMRIRGGEVVGEDELRRFTLRADDDGTPLTIATGATELRVRGTTNDRAETLDVTLTGDSGDLDTWLRRFDAPQLARRADRLAVRLHGPSAAPRVEVDADFSGVDVVGELSVTASMADRRVLLSSLRSGGLGGELTGKGAIDLDGPGGAPYLAGLTVSGRRLAAEKLAMLAGPRTPVRGTVDEVEVSARGSLGRRRGALAWLGLAQGQLRADRLEVAGETYRSVGMCINRPDAPGCVRADAPQGDGDAAACRVATRTGGSCFAATASREDGGVVDVLLSSAGAKGNDAVAGTVAITDLPAQVIARLVGAPTAVGGAVSTRIHVGGRTEAPTAEGAIALARGWIANTFLGDVDLALAEAPGRPGVVSLTGHGLGGTVEVEAEIALRAPYPATLRVRGRRLEVDPILDLAQLLGTPYPLQAWASGTITVAAELGAANPSPVAWVELDELAALVDYVDPSGRALPLRLGAVSAGPSRPAVSLRLTPTSIALACRARTAEGALVAPGAGDIAGPCPIQLATPVGAVTITGAGDTDAMALDASGVLDLALLAPLFGDRFDEVVGTGQLTAELRGTLAQPEYSAAIDLRELRLRPAGQDTVVRVPSGQLRLDERVLALADLRVRVDDTYLGRNAELGVHGTIGHEGLSPRDWLLIVDGEIAGKLLLALAPEVFSQASGVAAIDGALTITGTGDEPEISGAIDFSGSDPLTFVPRGLRREVAIRDGSLTIESEDPDGFGGGRTYGLSFDGVRAVIDGEGSLDGISGYVGIQDGAPASIDLALAATGIPFRIPRTLDLVLDASALRILRPDADAPLEVVGRLEVVSGRYIRNLELGKLLRPTPTVNAARPFWEEHPWLGNAALELGVKVANLELESNFGELAMISNDLRVTGTPRDPRVDGQISVSEGRLHIPGTRATFTRTRGSITFSPQQRLLEQTPTLAVTAESDYRDPSGQDNLITLVLSGPYPDIQWELGTSTGLTESQTVTLIALGRTPDQLRASLGDDAVGRDPTRIDPTAGTDTTITDQLLKEVASDWISSQIGDELLRYLPVDVFRPYITTGGFGLHAEKQVLERIDVVGGYENTVRAETTYVQAEARTPSRVTAQIGYVDKAYISEAEEDVTDLQGKIVWRFVWD